jgi:hypothetical protein
LQKSINKLTRLDLLIRTLLVKLKTKQINWSEQ